MGNTPVLGLPYMEDTDPLANVAAAIEALATAVESVHPRKWKSGAVSANTNASGDVVVAHGLGATPTAVLATIKDNTGSNWTVHAHTFGATTFALRFRIGNTGALVASTAVSASWQAIA